MLLLKHNGTVYGTVDREQFLPSSWLLRLNPGEEPARSLWMMGSYAASFFAAHEYDVLAARVNSHVPSRP